MERIINTDHIAACKVEEESITLTLSGVNHDTILNKDTAKQVKLIGKYHKQFTNIFKQFTGEGEELFFFSI